MDRPLYSLHLFAGAGGGILADAYAGVEPVCAVELEEYPRRVLALRWPGMAIWDDVRTFRADNPGCASAFAWLRAHSGELAVCGGFPCQDISSAGKQQGIDGERSGLWREFARILREIRPRFVFVENSANLVRLGLGRVLLDLAEIGFDARWNVLAAAAVGARHERERIWITRAMPPQLFPTVTISGNSNFKGASAKSGDGLFTVAKRLDSAAGGGNGRRRPLPATCTTASAERARGASALPRLWPTPNARDWKDTGPTQGSRHSPNLGTAVHARGGGEVPEPAKPGLPVRADAPARMGPEPQPTATQPQRLRPFPTRRVHDATHDGPSELARHAPNLAALVRLESR